MGLDAGRSKVLAALAALIAVVVVANAAASPRACTGGISSVGPAVLIHGHLDRGKSALEPHVRACVPHLRP
jgi:hypothetical protein